MGGAKERYWSLRDIILYIAYLMATIAGAYALLYTLSLPMLSGFSQAVTGWYSSQIEGLQVFIEYVVQCIILLFPLFLILLGKKKEFSFSRAFLFKKVSWYKWILYPPVALVLTMALILLINIVTLSHGVDLPGFHGQSTTVIGHFGRETIGLILAGFSGIILGPLVEEMIFRGFLLHALLGYFNPYIAVIINAILFSAFHFQFGVFFPLFILGTTMGLLTWRTGSIWPSIVFHIINNILAFMAEFYHVM